MARKLAKFVHEEGADQGCLQLPLERWDEGEWWRPLPFIVREEHRTIDPALEGNRNKRDCSFPGREESSWI